MKGVLVIIDGLADRPCKQLRGRTPLDMAEKPNLNFFVKNGRQGYMYPVKKGFVPGTHESIVSMFGLNWQDYPRGWLEALGVGMNLKKGDLALRTNFATIDDLKKRNVLDRRAGRNLTTKEARILAATLNKKINLGSEFIFKSTLQHRGVLVFRGTFSDLITDADPEYYSRDKKKKKNFKFSFPRDDNELAEFSANVLNNFLEQSFYILDKHPVNEKRMKKGFYPANIILARSPGIYIKKISKFRKWACSSSVPVINGICISLGMSFFPFKPVDLKNYDAYENLKKNLNLEIKKSIRLLRKRKKDFDYFLIYLKEVDVPGHDNKPIEKKEMIETIDKKLFGFLRKFAKKNNFKMIVTADHSTPCCLKAHSTDPVPVLVYDPDKKGDSTTEFSESQSRKGKLKEINVKRLLRFFSH